VVATRRNPGECGVHWEESRQRWFATVFVGYAVNGRRRKVKVSARTKIEAAACEAGYMGPSEGMGKAGG
jgi:hypothetical protein